MKQGSEIIIYQTEDGTSKLDVRLKDESVWLSLNQLSDLFQRDKSTISKHIKNIFIEEELSKDAVVAKYATTASHGKDYQVTHYNLNMIISLGYRVQLKIAPHFRRWATERLKEYIIKAFVLNDERLKGHAGGNY